MLDVVPATTPEDIEAIRTLFREYATSLGVDLSFQRFEEELARLPGDYAPPRGALLLAKLDGANVGCVAMRPLEAAVCEMKRLYLRPDARGKGHGRQLAGAILETARRAGYARMRLDTLDWMKEAMALYRSIGFREVPPYYPNPLPGATYFEREL